MFVSFRNLFITLFFQQKEGNPFLIFLETKKQEVSYERF
jgi:hypothetical protein